MKKILILFTVFVFLFSPSDVLAQRKSKRKPQAKTDPTLTLSKKSKKVRKKVVRKKKRAAIDLMKPGHVAYWRKEDLSVPAA